MAPKDKKKRSVGYLRQFYSQTWDVFWNPTSFKCFKELLDNQEFLFDADQDEDLHDVLEKIDSIISIMEKVLSITRKPVFQTDREQVVKRSETVSTIDREDFIETMKDTKVWKDKNGEKLPEFAHTHEAIDSLVKYENKFICLLVDLLSDEIDDFAFFEESLFLSMREEMESDYLNYSKHSFLNDFALFGFPYNRVFSVQPKKLDELHERIKKAKKYIRYAKGSTLYKQVHPYRINGNVLPTNILIHNTLYSACYRYYLDNYRSQDSKENSMDISFYNYAVLNLIRTLNDKEVGISDSAFHLDGDGRVHFDPLSFEKNGVSYVMREESSLAFSFEVTYKGEVSKSIVRVRRRIGEKDVPDVLLQRKRDAESFDNSIILVSSNKSGFYDRVLVCSYYRRNEDGIMNFIKSLTFLFPVEDILGICPLCGNRNAVIEGKKEYVCSSCEGVYAFVPEEKGYSLWVKTFMRKG